jgi:type IV pilus assembly protein PilM
MAALSGPVPGGNPFDPDAALVPAGGPAAPSLQPEPAAASPFDSSLFGPAPGGNPFGLPDDLNLNAFGPDAGASTFPEADPFPATPAAMSEEDYLRTQIADGVMPVLNELVTELRRSLDFYRNRANGLGAQQVVITGGTAKLPGLAEFLTINLEVPVTVGNPLEYLSTGPKADPNYLKDVGPVFPVSVGLAVRELVADQPASRKKR